MIFLGSALYMTDKKIDLFPKELLRHCSLKKNDEKLTVSIFIKMTKEGKILKISFGRSIIQCKENLTSNYATSLINENKEVTPLLP